MLLGLVLGGDMLLDDDLMLGGDMVLDEDLVLGGDMVLDEDLLLGGDMLLGEDLFPGTATVLIMLIEEGGTIGEDVIMKVLRWQGRHDCQDQNTDFSVEDADVMNGEFIQLPETELVDEPGKEGPPTLSS
ncbi:hypothetical protein PF005_g31698, partial [Phytophthora fragariae]